MSEDKEDKKLFDDVATSRLVLEFLKSIPEDIRDIFTPKTKDELLELEMNVAKWNSRSSIREKVMYLQKIHDLPLRPNAPMHWVMASIRIKQMKKERKYKDTQGGGTKGV